jgi:hypothetical protein
MNTKRRKQKKIDNDFDLAASRVLEMAKKKGLSSESRKAGNKN